jgi:hypothetical protein
VAHQARGQTQNQQTGRVCARFHTQAVRGEAEKANDPAAGDLLPAEGRPRASGALPSAALPGRTRPTIRQILGGRRPAVVAGVRVHRGKVDVVLFGLNGELGKFVKHLLLHRFRHGQKKLHKEDWQRLIGKPRSSRKEQPDWTQRAGLLRKIAVAPSEGVPLTDEPGGPTKAPNDIGVELLGELLAELPDGTPFRLRWLLEPAEQVPETQHWYDMIKDHFEDMCRVVGAALKAEHNDVTADPAARAGTDEVLTRRVHNAAQDDKQFWALFEAHCALLGLPPTPPVPKHLDKFRQQLKRRRDGETALEFPSKRLRDQRYAALRQSAAPRPPESAT